MKNSTEELKNSNDLISRQAAIDALAEDMPQTYTPDGSHPADEGIFMAQEIYADCIQTLKDLPSVQPTSTNAPNTLEPLDCVDRKAVLQRLTDISYNHCKTEGEAEAIGLAKTMVVTMPSVQPEQTDCEYCYEDSDGYVRPIEKNSHAWLVRRGKTMKLRICFKGEYRECDILFCPMCGRRLKNG